MASEYIDKAKTLKKLETALKDIARTDREDYIVATAIQAVRDTPCANVKPLIYGKRLYASRSLKTSDRICSVCGCSEKIYAYNKDKFKYCRQCGAKMNGGTGDEEIN